MNARFAALGLGTAIFLLGLAGFPPEFTSVPAVIAENQAAIAALNFQDGYSYVLGLFPTNYLQNLVHIAVGAFGIAAFLSLENSVLFLRVVAIAHSALVLMGLFPVTYTVFGLMPIFGNDIWLNALIGGIALYFGFLHPDATGDRISIEES